MNDPRLIGSLVFMIPALILVVPGAGEVSFGILALLGLVKILLLLFGPDVLLSKSLKPGPDYTRAGTSILVCMGFAIFGLTNLAFGHGIMNTFFVFIIAIALNQVRQESLVPATSTSPNKFNDPISAPTETQSAKPRPEPQA